MVDRKIRFVWNVGGGTGVVTHPEELERGNPDEDSSWYRIEAERLVYIISIFKKVYNFCINKFLFQRIRHLGRLTVHKQSSRSTKFLQVQNKTSSEFGRLDVSSIDRVWFGGIPEFEDKPNELLANGGLPGCVHQAVLNGKPIGLWNFVTTAADNACQPCVEG